MNTDATDNTLAGTRHVLQRTGFSESATTVDQTRAMSLAALLERRLHSTEPVSPLTPPDWVNDRIAARPDMKAMSDMDKRSTRATIRQRQNQQIKELRIWWINSLIQTRNPLGARMTLFWQNHFTSQHRKVRHSQLMYQQQQSFMRHATGNFGALLDDMLRDPALLIYLDNRVNRRKKPNENLARELLELFALGEGQYREKDIRELARALTGLSVDKHMEFRFNQQHHDPDEKNLLGSSGHFGQEEVVAILLAHPATATHLVNKLWRHFISETPDARLVESWAAAYRDSDYNMKVVLDILFSSDAFHHPDSHGRLIKSPVELIVGAHRVLDVPPVDGNSLVRASRSMQQILYDPPNVQGWVGGTHWINAHTLLARKRFVTLMLRNDAISFNTLQGALTEPELYAALLPAGLSTLDRSGNEHPIKLALRSPAFQLS